MTEGSGSGGVRGTWLPAVWARIGPWVTEATLVVAMYALYSVMRSASPDRVSLAFRNADAVEAAERALGLDIELPLNRLFLDNLWLADAASLWYQLAHMLVTFGLLAWLFVKRRSAYGLLRSSLGFLWLAGLATYYLYPLAPPRFALDGAVDTMTEYPLLFAGRESVTGLANLYAAMPSLHVGWAAWCAIAFISVTKGPWRWLACLYPLTTTFVVVGTGNHYVLDAVAGTAYAVVCWLAVRFLNAWLAERKSQSFAPVPA